MGEAEREQSRTDIAFFAEYYLRLELRPHQLIWLAFLIRKGTRKLLLAPRGHGKSTIVTYVYMVWMICYDPTLRILMVSHKEQKGNQFARRIQVALLHNPRIQADFGLKKAKPWRVGYCYLKDPKTAEPYAHPLIEVVGTVAGMTGGRYDVVIFDDLLTQENTRNPKNREKIMAWVFSEIIPAIDPTPKECMIVVGTRKHVEDWYGVLLQNQDYQHLVDRVILEDGTPLWPERFTPEKIEKLKRELPPEFFAREYMNEPAPAEGFRLKRDWLKYYEALPPSHRLDYYLGVDPGLGKSDAASYFAVVCAAIDTHKEHVYIIDAYRGKHSLAEQLEIVEHWNAKYSPKSICVESVMAYAFFYEIIDEKLPNVVNVDYMHTPLKGTTSQRKIARIENVIGHACKEGIVYLPNPDIHHFIHTFIEMEYIPFPDGEMDMLDAANLAISQMDEVIARDQLPIATM